MIKTMKKTLLYTSIIVLGALAAASCNLNNYPVFDDNDAFVAFDDVALTFNEPSTLGEPTIVEVPVTLASVAGLSASVSYEVIDTLTSAQGGAVQGIDFNILDETGVLRFDSEHRTVAVQIELLADSVGTYTGDKTFSIRLVSSPDVNIGEEHVCNITISDGDDPRSHILGAYAASDGTSAWTMNITPDPEDVNIVWIDKLWNNTSFPAEQSLVYGLFSAADGTITVGLGQTLEYVNDGNAVTLVGAVNAGGNSYSVTDSGEVVGTISDNGNKIVFSAEEFNILTVMDGTYIYDLTYIPITATK